MKAIICEDSKPKLAITKLLSLFNPSAFLGKYSPVQLKTIPDPVLPAEDWAVIDTKVCGMCGSDYKQVFMHGTLDNPMTAMISWPQVLGHEAVGVISKVGSEVTTRKVGDRVVLNPWLSCVTRGLEPCEFCRQGNLAQCLNFGGGYIERGIHHGNSSTATGGFAQQVPAHESQWIPIPDGVSNEAAALADPFSVSFHAILKAPPRENGKVMVYGCGTLGLLAIIILRALYPTVTIFAVARFQHQEKLARQLGAHHVLKHKPTRKIIELVANALGTYAHEPWQGLPMLNDGLDAIYDTVSAPETLEVGVRITRSRGSIVLIGVEPPKRFEWTPIYFKEISVIGSNGFGIEEYDGRRQHGFKWYFEFIQTKGIDATAIITHHYVMDDYKKAFMTCYKQGESSAVKVLFNKF